MLLLLLLARAPVSSKRPLLSVDVSVYCVCVCVPATLILNMSESISDLGVHVQYGLYGTVPTARRLVTSSMTTRESVTSNSRRYNL